MVSHCKLHDHLWLKYVTDNISSMGFGTQFMQGVGLSQDDSFHLTIGQDCLGLVGCFIAWWIMTRYGRRPIYLVGLSAIFIILMIVGFIGLAPPTNKSASLAGGILIILMIFCFQVSLLTPSLLNP